MPTGAFEVSDLEVRTAVSTRHPWLPAADLSVAEFGDTWQVRLACHGGSLRVGDEARSGRSDGGAGGDVGKAGSGEVLDGFAEAADLGRSRLSRGGCQSCGRAKWKRPDQHVEERRMVPARA